MEPSSAKYSVAWRFDSTGFSLRARLHTGEEEDGVDPTPKPAKIDADSDGRVFPARGPYLRPVRW